MAGLRNADGDIVVCLDDDGQTPANEVGKLLAGTGNRDMMLYMQAMVIRNIVLSQFRHMDE